MYFLEQIQKQFIAQCINYEVNPAEIGPTVEEAPIPEAEAPAQLDWTLEQWDSAVNSANSAHDALLSDIDDLSVIEARNTELTTLSEWIEPTSWELSDLWVEDGTEVSLEQRREILQWRLEAIEWRELPHDGSEYWSRRIIESEYVAEIAEAANVDPQLLMDLRAAGFQWADSWEDGEVMENYEALLEEAQRLAESWDIDLSEMSASEFMEFYESIEQNEPWVIDDALDRDEATDLWIVVVEDWNGLGIDPNTPWAIVSPNGTVRLPNGTSSSGWQIFNPGPSEISPDAGRVTYDSLTEYDGGTPLTESQRSQVSNPENIPIIEARFPQEWHDIAIEFANEAWEIDPNLPIWIASMPNLVAIVSYPWEPPRIEESPIAIGRNGYGPQVQADHDVPWQSWDARTQTWRVQHFGRVRIAWVGNLAWWSTMTGAIIESPEWRDRWGRWWHGWRDGRFPGQNSLWCVVAPDEFMIRLAQAVQSNWGGYGFQSASRLA